MHEIIVPKIEANTEEVTFVEWKKKVGDYVKKGEPLFLIETIKAIIEIEAEETGYLKKTLVDEGDEVNVLDIVAYLGNKNEILSELPMKYIEKIKLSPSAKKLVKKYNINVNELFKDYKKVVKEKDILDVLKEEKGKKSYHIEKITSKKRSEIKNIQNNCKTPISSVSTTISSKLTSKAPPDENMPLLLTKSIVALEIPKSIL